jgi:hypothetical protein
VRNCALGGDDDDMVCLRLRDVHFLKHYAHHFLTMTSLQKTRPVLIACAWRLMLARNEQLFP